MLEDIRGMAAARDEARLWELWAMAAGGLIFNLGSSDPAAARALFEEVRALPPEILQRLGLGS